MRALGDKIVFKFLDETTSHSFAASKTEWGFMLQDPPGEVKVARWGQVVAIGPEVRDVSVGQYVLIEPLMWTNKITSGDETVWGTDITKVMLVSDERPNTNI